MTDRVEHDRDRRDYNDEDYGDEHEGEGLHDKISAARPIPISASLSR